MKTRLTILLASLAANQAAGDLPLSLPVDCLLGTDCYIQQTVDHDPSESATDFQCGSLSYDGHMGTDFALLSLAAQRKGVNVLAAADGVVTGLRDGMADILQVGPDAPDVSGRECGNGVVLGHPNGWETQYCHLAEGSVAVALGDRVTSGAVLGDIGLSGRTQFPHLHLAVRNAEKEIVDPFTARNVGICGVTPSASLWIDDINLKPGGFITSGFSDDLPDYTAIKAGGAAADVLQDDQPLVLWGYMFGARAGDTLHMRISGPEGHVMDDSFALEKAQSQLVRMAGRKPPTVGWPVGTYVGEIQMIRDGTVIDASQALVVVR